jgi:hypothetical protein
MATVINNPAPSATTESSSSGLGFLLGVIALIVFLFVVLYYGGPALRSMTRGANSGAQINVPDKINVDVNQNP